MSEPWTLGPWDISGLERDFSIWGVAKGMEVGNREAICFDVQRIEDARLISLAPDLAELVIELAGPPFSEDERIEVTLLRQAARRLRDRARGEA